MSPDGGTAPWVPSEVPCGRQQLESQKTESQPQGRRGAGRCGRRRAGGSSCKQATNACQVQGSGLHSGFVFIASTLETELNSSQQKNKDNSELYRNSRREIHEYDFPVKSSIFLFTPCDLYVAEPCALAGFVLWLCRAAPRKPCPARHPPRPVCTQRAGQKRREERGERGWFRKAREGFMDEAGDAHVVVFGKVNEFVAVGAEAEPSGAGTPQFTPGLRLGREENSVCFIKKNNNKK